MAKRIRLARLRKASGYTQESLAEALGVDRTTVSTWEAGSHEPSPHLRPGLGSLLAVSRRELTDIPDEANGVVRSSGGSAEIRRSQQEWLRTRRAEGARGRELSELAAWLYPESARGPGGHVLRGPGWLLDEPVELDGVRLGWAETPPPPGPVVEHVLPLTDRGTPYGDYSRAVRDLVRPRLMENRPSYRLTGIDTSAGLALDFGLTTFFAAFDAKQAVAHEFKAAWTRGGRALPSWGELPIRSGIGDPFDPARWLMSPGISTLTVRRDSRGAHQFVLHERDGAKVADGGGLAHVMPAGEFQPVSDPEVDFSLWRNIMREFSEEFLGNPEHDGSASGPVDYAAASPFRELTELRDRGDLTVWHYGLIMEPLELGASQLTVAVVDGDEFDSVFGHGEIVNDEGTAVRHAFTGDTISRLEPRLSGSALTLLRLAWRDRKTLL
ncbi:helix-turn-helix transcriptional regulator [Actinokineospora diospyrosa]|uniref:Helix-turn-helix protein n=1 Tax=Actinokineospora diospyrosa TaxID=103728 RepID=A0ABT1I7S9_9PSEU|nr:helix-turn-helix transcriptional regulator [Actinokineospora diospyrosa]MCP2268456.1 helix-turn-helix protein [Actinokineospora diospyrosa]